ncbi:MAG: hypothetical protein ABWY12_18915 [Burkholderiales bacterium]
MNLRRTLVPIVTRYGSVAVQLLVVTVVAQKLDAVGTAQYFTLMGWVLTSYFWVGAGLPDGAVKEVPALVALGHHDEAARVIRRTLAVGFGTIPIGFLASVGFGYQVSHQWGAAFGVGLWWSSYAAIFISAQILVAAGSPALGSAIFYGAANLGQLCVTIPAVLLLPKVGTADVLTLTGLGTALTAAASVVVVVRVSRRSIALVGTSHGNFHPLPEDHVRSALRSGAAIAVGRFVQAAIIWTPVWVAGVALNAESAADMGIASRLVSAVAGVIAAVRFSVRPEIAAAAAVGDWDGIERTGRRIAAAASALAVVAIVVTAGAGEFMIPMIFGDAHRGVAALTVILLFGTLGESFGGPVDETLKMSGDANFVLSAQTVVVAISASLQFLSATYLGPETQAATYAFGFSALYAVLISKLSRARGVLLVPGGWR